MAVLPLAAVLMLLVPLAAGCAAPAGEPGGPGGPAPGGDAAAHPPAGNHTLAVDDHGKRWTLRCTDGSSRCERQPA